RKAERRLAREWVGNHDRVLAVGSVHAVVEDGVASLGSVCGSVRSFRFYAAGRNPPGVSTLANPGASELSGEAVVGWTRQHRKPLTGGLDEVDGASDVRGTKTSRRVGPLLGKGS